MSDPSVRSIRRRREETLSNRIGDGDLRARNELAVANLPFVAYIARQYQHCGLEWADLLAAGNLGLLLAAGRFDCDKGKLFANYASWWIRRMIRQAIFEGGRTVRLPEDRQKAQYRLARAAVELRRTQGCEPVAADLASVSGVPLAEADDWLSGRYRTASLDAPIAPETSLCLADTLAQNRFEAADDTVLRLSEYSRMEGALHRLPPRECRVLELFFGLAGNERHNLAQIGLEMGLSRERARQIKEGALNRLRRYLRLTLPVA